MKTKDAWRSTFPRILRPGITGGSRDGRVHEIGDQGALRNADVSTQLSACNENTDLFLSNIIWDPRCILKVELSRNPRKVL